jgi:hypothetical protein
MRRLIVGLVIVAALLVLGPSPSSARGWYGYGHGGCGYFAPRAYGYSYYRPAVYRPYYRPSFVYGSFYRPRVWGPAWVGRTRLGLAWVATLVGPEPATPAST